jgi:hypothetical protein
MMRAMGFEITGQLKVIFDTEQKSERFRVRHFVIETADNPQYPQVIQFQLTNDRCDNLDGFNIGDEVKVEFSLRGREWTSPSGDVKYFNSLDTWKIQAVAARQGSEDAGGFGDSAGFGGGGAFGNGPADDIPAPGDDDIPF